MYKFDKSTQQIIKTLKLTSEPSSAHLNCNANKILKTKNSIIKLLTIKYKKVAVKPISV